MIHLPSFARASSETVLLILKLVIPFYILADILFYYGIPQRLNFLFEPIAALLNLPPETTLALMAGMLFTLYPAIAFAAPLDLTAYEWTILGIFLGICHSLVVETAIIKKLGVSAAYTILLRVSTGLTAAAILRFLPKEWFDGARISQAKAAQTFNHFSDMLFNSIKESIILAAEIIILVMVILFVLELVKQSAWLKNKQEKVSMSFSILISALLGITYGAGVLISESRSGKLSKKDILYISTFSMIFHAIIEDTLLFVIFGANMWVMVLIRLALALLISGIVIKAYMYQKN